MTRSPRPKIADGAIICATVALMGAPTVLGDHLNYGLGLALFWGGIACFVLYVGWRWGGWFFGIVSGTDVHPATIDNRGGAHVGGSNSGPQTVFNGPVHITHAPPTTPLYEVQLQEFRDIDDFVGKKNEMPLRETFDIPDNVKYNILLAKQNIAPDKVSPERTAEINVFFKDGTGAINTKYAKLSRPHGNAVQYEKLDGKIGVINHSAKFNASMFKLQMFAASSTLPTDVKVALADMEKTIASNMELLLDVINERYSVNRNNLLHEDDPASTRYGAISSPYWEKFVHLRPKAEAISEAIRRHLEIK